MNACDPKQNMPRPHQPETGKIPVPGPTNLPPSGVSATGHASGRFYFNAIHISQLPQKIDGETEHLFIAILNGEAVGSVMGKDFGPPVFANEENHRVGIRRLHVQPKDRHRGIATRLMRAVEEWARSIHATQLDLACRRENIPARNFYIRRCRFIDDTEHDPNGMSKAL